MSTPKTTPKKGKASVDLNVITELGSIEASLGSIMDDTAMSGMVACGTTGGTTLACVDAIYEHQSSPGSPYSLISPRSFGSADERSRGGRPRIGPKKSTFKSALEDIRVPDHFFAPGVADGVGGGVHVYRVGSHGKLERAILTLSKDRFTITVSLWSSAPPPPASPMLSSPRKLSRKLLPRPPSLIRRSSSGSNARPTSIGSVSTFGGGGDSSVDGDGGSSVAGSRMSLASNGSFGGGGGSSGDAEWVVDIGSVDRIQSGLNTLKFEVARLRQKKQSMTPKNSSSTPILDASKCFSLIFRGGTKTLDLMVVDYSDEMQQLKRGDREEILYVLNSILKGYAVAKWNVGNEVLLLRYIWNDVDRDKSNTLNAKEIGDLLNKINFQAGDKSLHKKNYNKFAKTMGLDNATKKRGLTFEQCVTMLHKTKRDTITWQLKPVTHLFFVMFGQLMNNNTERKKVSTVSFLEKFLHEVQGEEDKTIDDVKAIFVRLGEKELKVVNPVEEKYAAKYISLDHFEAYLLGQENDIFSPEREQFHEEDMNKPLSEYWINSSHNTYLTGDQLISKSSVEMYVKVLYRGCRCLELDIWDGGKDEMGKPIPIVYHGHTMTSQIDFKDIIESFKVFLMHHPKTYPLILSLENHCTIPYQQVMATHLKSILGEKLYIPDEASLAEEPLPSPAQLRGMVVLKGRRPVGLVEEYDTDDDTAADDSTEQSSIRTDRSTEQKKIPKSVKIAPELAKLTLFHGTNFKSWDVSMNNPTHHMHSFNESRVRSFCKHQHMQKLVIYNQSHMSRTFPSGKRVDSSNYSPILAWSTGCQMVALNFQTSDPSTRINDGRFRCNAERGYVLKPSSLMAKDFIEPEAMVLVVKVLSGSCLPKPRGLTSSDRINPYVNVSLFDCHNGSELTSSQSTKAVSNNGFSPIWNGLEVSFNFTVQTFSVAVLQFTVMHQNTSPKHDEFIASASVPISCMRKGIRSVQLFDANNTRSGAFDFASLLVLIEFEQCQAEI